MPTGSNNAIKPAASAMLAIVKGYEAGERSTAVLFLSLELGLFVVACSILAALFIAPPPSAIGGGLVAIISACLTAIALTMRGKHQEALKKANRWAGFANAYQYQGLDDATLKDMNEIVFLESRDVRRDEPKSRQPARLPKQSKRGTDPSGGD